MLLGKVEEPFSIKVLWRSDVIGLLCSQNSEAEWVRYPVGPNHWSVMTRGRGLDKRLATSAIPALDAENATSPSPSILNNNNVIVKGRLIIDCYICPKNRLFCTAMQ